MNWYHALLFVHVLAAFLAVAGVVMYLGFLTATGSGASAPGQAPLLRLAPLATGLWNVGGLGTIIFGVWLAINRPQYELWDAWVIAAIVLWVIASAAGGRVGVGYRALRRGTGAPASAAIHAAMAVAVALLLIDMIYKPGA
jgi:hypothetical protein